MKRRSDKSNFLICSLKSTEELTKAAEPITQTDLEGKRSNMRETVRYPDMYNLLAIKSVSK